MPIFSEASGKHRQPLKEMPILQSSHGFEEITFKAGHFNKRLESNILSRLLHVTFHGLHFNMSEHVSFGRSPSTQSGIVEAPGLAADQVERLTFTVLWEMTPKAEIVDTSFCKALAEMTPAFSCLF